jgi:hypothetical protein
LRKTHEAFAGHLEVDHPKEVPVAKYTILCIPTIMVFDCPAGYQAQLIYASTRARWSHMALYEFSNGKNIHAVGSYTNVVAFCDKELEIPHRSSCSFS